MIKKITFLFFYNFFWFKFVPKKLIINLFTLKIMESFEEFFNRKRREYDEKPRLIERRDVTEWSLLQSRLYIDALPFLKDMNHIELASLVAMVVETVVNDNALDIERLRQNEPINALPVSLN